MKNSDFNKYGIPSADELEKLANALFSSNPAEEITSALQSTGQIIPSGFGVSPGSLGSIVNSQNTNKPVANHFVNESISNINLAQNDLQKASIFQPVEFNVDDPNLFLKETNFQKEEIPGSLSGFGGQSSLENTKKNIHVPGHDMELNSIVNQIISYGSYPQIPIQLDGFHKKPNFYFLNNLESDSAPFQDFSARDSSFNTSSVSFVTPPFNINKVKKDFPILNTVVNGKQIVWLDNAATTHKPKLVIDRISYFYEHENSNIHRAAHELAARATDAYEAARKKVQLFIKAPSVNEIIFVRGTTEGINLIANSWGDQYLGPGDEIILSLLEHHANIVPWQLLAKKKGFTIKVIPVDEDGQVIISEYGKLLNNRTKIVSFTQVSNALGTITPAKEIIEMAHRVGAKTVVDGAQSISHMPIDVASLNTDFFVFSGHKIFGPTGIGVVYGKEDLLNQIQPYQGGGNMIKDVRFEHTEFHNAPTRFEAGTGNIADAVGLGAAIDYVNSVGMDLIAKYENALLQYGIHALKTVPGLRLIGTAPDKASIMSFIIKGHGNDEIGQALNKEGIAVRTGHHCAQPILRRFGLESSVRPSLAFYNTCSDINKLVETLHRIVYKK
ncbi:MAG: segregation protein B [Leptospira sp.]|nr:MAG: segregation protein B [Leptospira sp.]